MVQIISTDHWENITITKHACIYLSHMKCMSDCLKAKLTRGTFLLNSPSNDDADGNDYNEDYNGHYDGDSGVWTGFFEIVRLWDNLR